MHVHDDILCTLFQLFEESMEDIQMKFFHINERLTELEDSPGLFYVN